jgi:hypothetical protein
MVLITSILYGQNTYMVSVHTGLGNPLKTNLRATEDLSNNSTAQFKGLNTSGFMFTTKVNEKFSFGLDLMYGSASVNFDENDTLFANGQWVYTTTNYDITKRRLRVQFRFNKHFGNNPNFDQYVGFGVGGNKRWRKEFVNDTLITSDTSDPAVPISMRVCYGFQYYPIYNLGIGGEVGLGGPFLQLMVTYKF